MDKKGDIINIWRECFPDDSAGWRDMFFSSAYADEWAMTMADDSGRTVSSLLLLPYSMTFHGQRAGLAYIYGAGTLRRYRARGFMGRLMCEALLQAARRGDTFAALIPAGEGLRRYYARFGFSTVGFHRPQRFASVHRFEPEGSYIDVSSEEPMRLYPGFAALMAERSCSVQHTLQQFLTVMADVTLSDGYFAAVAREEGGEPVAMAWARPKPYSAELIVTEMIAADADAATAVLNALQRRLPAPMPMVVMRTPADTLIGGDFTPGAMVRVVGVQSALAAVAAAHPDLALSIRVTDRLIGENSGTYRLGDAACRRIDGSAPVQLSVDASVLSLLLFSSTPIANVMGLPGCRPRLTLLMD